MLGLVRVMKKDLTPASVHRGLRTKLIGQSILYYPEATSTMDVAKQAVREGAKEGVVVIAERQTAGRGRLGRAWLAPPESSILLSIILYPTLEQLPQLNMVASLAVAQSIGKVTELKPVIKWPNDVLIQGKKVCGILIESDVQGEAVNFAIVGIGINVNLDPSSLPEVSETASSLGTLVGREVSRLELLQALLGEFEALYSALRRGQPVDELWRRRLDTLGKEVTVKCGAEVMEGLAESADERGNLLLRCPDGRLLTIAASEVTLRV